jgi:hypothetical protein
MPWALTKERKNATFTASDGKTHQANQSTVVAVTRSKRKTGTFDQFLNYSFCYLNKKRQDVTPYCPMAVTQDACLPS